MNARKLVVPEELLAGPFTRESALRAGLSRSALENPAILRVAPRACLARAVPSLLDRVNAHALTLPGDVLVEGITALHLDGVGIGDIAVLRFCSARGRDIRRRGVRGRRVRTAPPHRRRIVTPIGALSTAAPDLPLVELVAAGDWLLRLGRVTLNELRSALAESGDRTPARFGERPNSFASGWTLLRRLACGCCWCLPDCPNPTAT